MRTWEGQQSRAFEELSFQLLKGRVPAGTRAIRTGNPDGGIEWYATLQDGSQWGWQAKHVHGIETLLAAMTESVKRVTTERPEVRKMTFVISWNLATGTNGGKYKSQRQKYVDKVRAWQKSIPGVEKIEFDLLQESDLLDELAKPEHNGRRWFWWDQIVFGKDWLAQRFRVQANAAGEKYRPDLQVDIPIQDDLVALGFDLATVGSLDRLLRNVILASGQLPSPSDPTSDIPAYEAVHRSANYLREAAICVTLQPRTLGDGALEPLRLQFRPCLQAIEAALEYERGLAIDWRKLPEDDPRKADKPAGKAWRYIALRRAINELASWLDSTVGQALQHRAYFLTGQAGAGKTHLLLDATRRALDVGRPAVFLAGGQFGRGDLWASIADQLGLGPVGADVLLGAMDAVAEASSDLGSRFVIFVDALNETTPPSFWRTQLPILRSAIDKYHHIALVVTCRDTYTDLVLDGNEGDHYMRRGHPGFTDREVEAAQSYYAHYGLEAPKFPLLTPEFSLPLFLRMFCESLSQCRGPLPTGHQGRIFIFERYIEAKIFKVALRLRPDATSGFELEAAKSQVRQSLDALLDEMSLIGRESIDIATANRLLNKSLPGVDSIKVLGLLQEEGVLTQERLYLGQDELQEGVRIVFQAFSDFLLLKRRLALSKDPTSDRSVRSWLATDCSWGILEAATILFPEAFEIELADFLKLAVPKKFNPRKNNRIRQILRSFVETLPHRDSKAITERTVELLDVAQLHVSRSRLYQVLFAVSPQPSNRLNGERLHSYLLRPQMPSRDGDFGIATYYELSNPASIASRLARWAAAGPYPRYDPKVVELACIPLCWLLSSPNRFMRDWVTKALVQLLRGHLDVMRSLVERFWTVDDPYVVQRVIVVAYGCLMRSTPEQTSQAQALSELVHRLVYAQPVRPDELLLDAALGITRWAVFHKVLPSSALVATKRPLGLTEPREALSDEEIEQKFGWREGQPDDESYSSVYFSLASMGDFARYVVEPGVHHFSRFRLGKPYRKQRPRKPRVIESKLLRFIKSMSVEQYEEFMSWFDRADPSFYSFSPSWFRKNPLSDEQRELWRESIVYPEILSEE